MGVRALDTPTRETVRSFQKTIPVRGCRISLEDVRAACREFSDINRKFGQEHITPLAGEGSVEFDARRNFLLRDAFCLTITVCGGRDEEVYDESEDIFSSKDLPEPIKSIHFTNLTAWRRHAGNVHLPNQIEVHLDFSKPDLIDPHLLVSDPTPNDSSVSVRAQDMTYLKAVQQVVKERLLNRQAWYSPIHRG